MVVRICQKPPICILCVNFNVWKLDLGKVDFLKIQEKGQH